MWNWVPKLLELYASGEPFAIVTVTRSRGSTPREGGAKMLVLADGRFFGTVGGGQLEREAINDAKKCIVEGQSRQVAYPLCSTVGQCCGGNVELFVEVMNREPRLYLFGAGHVGQAVCRTLVGTPFKVFLVDERPEWINSDQLPADVTRVSAGWREFIETAKWDEGSFSVIMTHQHELDLEILRALLDRPARYLGMIGSETKWETHKKKLLSSGAPQESIERVTCPIGFDTGGKAPQEIAISLAAQLLATYYGRR